MITPFLNEETDVREFKLFAEATQPVGLEAEFELRQSELMVFYTSHRIYFYHPYAKNRTVKH